jgi:hypothetical protein
MPSRNKVNEDIVNPYDFDPQVKKTIAGVFESLALVTVGNGKLQYCVNVKSPTELTVFVSNDWYTNEKFDLIGKKVRIKSVTEIDIEDGAPADPNYFPACVSAGTEAATGDGFYTLNAGDCKLFSVSVEPRAFRLAPEISPKRRRSDLFLSVDGSKASLKDRFLLEPTMGKYFAGMKVSAVYLENMDIARAKKEAAYLKRQKVGLIVDFSEMINHYPDLSLIGNIPSQQKESMSRIGNILKKAALYGCRAVVVGPHRNSECSWTREEAELGFIASFNQITRMAAKLKIKTYFRNAKTFMKPKEYFEAMAGNLEVPGFAYDSSNGLCARFDLNEMKTIATPGMLLLSAPHFDEYGQAYLLNAPVFRSPQKNELKKMFEETAAGDHDFIVLSADYKGWDEVWADLKFLGVADRV